MAQLRAQWSRPPGLLATRMVDMGVQTSLVSDLSILAWKLVQQVAVTKNLEEDVIKKRQALGRACPARCEGHQVEVDPAVVWALRRAVKGATQGDLRGEREQREKEEREKRLTQREKREKEEKERNDELVSNLKVECWELYRCTRGWTRKSDKFDSVKGVRISTRRLQGGQRLAGVGARRGGLKKRGRSSSRSRPLVWRPTRDQDVGADGSRSPPAEPVGPYPSVNRGTSGRDSFGN